MGKCVPQLRAPSASPGAIVDVVNRVQAGLAVPLKISVRECDTSVESPLESCSGPTESLNPM